MVVRKVKIIFVRILMNVYDETIDLAELLDTNVDFIIIDGINIM